MPEAKQLHKDRFLSEFSVQYQNDEMIWEEILPIVDVGKRSDAFVVYSKEDSYRIQEDRVGAKSQSNEIDYGTGEDNYSVKGHSLAGWVPQENVENADEPMKPLEDENDFLNRGLHIAQEKRVADKVFAAATYPSGNKVTLSGTGQWGQSADDPIGDVLNAVETCFQRANTIIFGQAAWQIFRKLPEVLDAVKSSSRFQGSPGGIATNQEVAALFEVERVLVGRARYITSKEGQTATYARLWGKHCAALYVAKNVGLKTVTFGKTFSQRRRATFRDFDAKRGEAGAHYLKVSWNSDEKIVASDLGYFIENAVP